MGFIIQDFDDNLKLFFLPLYFTCCKYKQETLTFVWIYRHYYKVQERSSFNTSCKTAITSTRNTNTTSRVQHC